MTTTEKLEKVSAGYFDSTRGEPIYTGDVYRDGSLMLPYFLIIRDEAKGFMAHHLGCPEKFLLSTEAQHLIKREYLGNVIDDEQLRAMVFDGVDYTIDYKAEKISTSEKESEKSEDITDDSISENTPDEVKAFLNGETEELPEGTEEITTEEAVELVNNGTVVIDMSGDDVVSAEATTDSTETPETTENTETHDTMPETDTDEKEPENPTVIASTKEEKRLQEQRNDYKKHIETLNRKIELLETEALNYEHLASTLTHQPFIELRNLLSTAVQEKAKVFDVKEAQKHLNNLKAIDSMVAVLNEFKQKAEDNRANIELNKKEIDGYEIKIEDINSKLTNFQTKLCFVENEEATDSEEESTENEVSEPENEPNNEPETEPDNEVAEDNSDGDNG